MTSTGTTRSPGLSEFTVAFRAWLAPRSLHPSQRLLFEEGWTAWGWPPEVGGRGGPVVLRGIVYEELCRAGYRLPDAFYAVETIAPMIVESAPDLAARYLRPFLLGDELWCQGFSEPDAGSDLAALRCRATPDDGGFTVNGQKIWVSFGHLASRCVLLARTGTPDSRHRGLSVFLVDLDSAGVTVRPIRSADGRLDFSELFFDDVRVPADRLIGRLNDGWSVAMYLLQWERGMYAWQRQASLHTELAAALATAEEPVRPAVAVGVGTAYRSLHALRLASRRTLERLSAGENPGPVISVDKILLATAEQAVFDVVRELSPFEFAFGDGPGADLRRTDFVFSRAASIYGGATEIQRSILADRVLGLPREGS